MDVNATPGTHPALITVESLGLPETDTVPAVLQVGRDGRRCYLALSSSGSLRQNVGVVDLDADGSPLGGATWYADGGPPLPLGHRAVLTSMLEDPDGRCLYLGLDGTPVRPVEGLVAQPLQDGVPSGRPSRFVGGHVGGLVQGIARHPGLDLLYTVAGTDGAVVAHALRADGLPDGTVQKTTFGAPNKYEIAVSAGGERLYLGVSPDCVEVVDLDVQGRPVPASLDTFQGPPMPPTPGNGPNWFSFLLTPRALYRRRTPKAAHLVPVEWPLAVWPLDDHGRPVGQAQVFEALTGRVTTVDPGATRVTVVGDRVIPDALQPGVPMRTGSVVRSAPLGVDGMPGEVTVTATPRRRTAVVSAAAPSARVAAVTSRLAGVRGNETAGWRLRFTPLEVRTAAGPVAGPVTWRVGTLDGAFNQTGIQVPAGQTSPWVPLDAALARFTGQRSLSVTAMSVTPVLVRLRVDVADGDGAVVRTMTDTVAGKTLCLLVPGYDVPFEGERAALVELLSEHAARLEGAAAAVAVPAGERPVDLLVSGGQIRGPQAHLGQLRAQVRTVRQLGFNTAYTYDWGGLPAAQVDEVLVQEGLTRRLTARSTLPAMFSFDTDNLTPARLQATVDEILTDTAVSNGGAPAQIDAVILADEPAWYPPSVVTEIATTPTWLAAFRGYLQDQGLTPGDVGAGDWDDVLPIPRVQVTAEATTRRLFLHTMRFLAEGMTGAIRLLRDVLAERLGHPALIGMNVNNQTNRWLISSPRQDIGKNPDNDYDEDPAIGPSLAMGGLDWLHAGRAASHTPHSMDSTTDVEAQHCSFLADGLRSAAGEADFGCYVRGQTIGQFDAGASYKILALVGHGAKLVDAYTFGPRVYFKDGWSDVLAAYRPLARATSTLGRAGGVLARGRRARGTVALLSPGTSNLWDTDQAAGLYLAEVEALHTALTHRGYTVDLVDQTDLEQGALSRYDVLYGTGPNLTERAQRAIARWVEGGGTLALTPGAMTADELDRPSTLLDGVLGLTGRARDRFLTAGAQAADVVTFPGTGGFAGPADAVMPVTVPITPLTRAAPGSAVVLATFGAGAPAVTAHRHGAGRAFAYGFFPGLHYRGTADRSRTDRVPAGWGSVQREAVVAPARLSGTPRPVTVDVPGVEACRLDAGPDGTAIVLLNWTGAPLDDIVVTVAGLTGAQSVRSTERGPLTAAPAADGLTVRLPLTDVDVVVLDDVAAPGTA